MDTEEKVDFTEQGSEETPEQNQIEITDENSLSQSGFGVVGFIIALACLLFVLSPSMLLMFVCFVGVVFSTAGIAQKGRAKGLSIAGFVLGMLIFATSVYLLFFAGYGSGIGLVESPSIFDFSGGGSAFNFNNGDFDLNITEFNFDNM